MFLAQNTDTFQCSICLDRFHDPVILVCEHSFDRTCLQEFIDQKSTPDQHSVPCPICRRPFDLNECFTSNRSLIRLVPSKPVTKFYFIDVASTHEKQLVLDFLHQMFEKRYMNNVQIQ
jgi:hypothetical protein